MTFFDYLNLHPYWSAFWLGSLAWIAAIVVGKICDATVIVFRGYAPRKSMKSYVFPPDEEEKWK